MYNKLKLLTAKILEQILYYVALIVGLLAWAYFQSAYIAIAIFIIGILVAWLIAFNTSGDDDFGK